MASFWTTRGKQRHLLSFFHANSPANFYLALATSDVTPTFATNIVSDVTEIALGNGYDVSGGVSLSRNSIDFTSLTEDDPNNNAYLVIKPITWTASGGSIPSSGNAARYAILTDDNATVADRDVIICFDLGFDRSVADGIPLTLENLTIRNREP